MDNNFVLRDHMEHEGFCTEDDTFEAADDEKANVGEDEAVMVKIKKRPYDVFSETFADCWIKKEKKGRLRRTIKQLEEIVPKRAE